MRRVALVLIGLFLLSVVPGTAIAQESVWTELAPATSPPGRGAYGMAYDAESDRIVLFGGQARFESSLMDDTWAYDFNANTWTNRNPGNGPSPRSNHAMAYDAESDRVILFGGPAGPETWAYDYNANAWTNMSPVVQPAAWYGVDMAYNSESDRIVLFGGCAGDSYYTCRPVSRGETWVYDYNANSWTNRTSGTSPSDRLFHRMAYDSDSDRIVLFGGLLGIVGINVLGDTWAYNYNANSWTEMSPEVDPPPDDTHGLAYDASADRIILYGGFFSLPATWTYDFDSDTWTQTNSGMGPSPRGAPGLAYDTESDRIVLFGGNTGTSLPNLVGNDETWALLPPTPTPIPPWVYIVLGVVAAAVVAVVAMVLTRRRRRVQKGEEGE